MLHHGLLLGDAPPAAVFSDHDTLLELLFEQYREILRTLWTTCGIAGLALLEARMLRWFPVAHLIIRISIIGHRALPPRLRVHRKACHSPRVWLVRLCSAANVSRSRPRKQDRVRARSNVGLFAPRRSRWCRCRDSCPIRRRRAR